MNLKNTSLSPCFLAEVRKHLERLLIHCHFGTVIRVSALVCPRLKPVRDDRSLLTTAGIVVARSHCKAAETI